MNKIVSFFGHSMIIDRKTVEAKLEKVVLDLIKQGVKTFKVGTHGDFDNLALCICKSFYKRLRYKY